ncbi:MAG: ATP-binding protein [Thermodesulfobacteriota bacterium]
MFKTDQPSYEALKNRVRELEKTEKELKQSLQALSHNQEMLSRTESVAEVGSWEWDIATDKVIWSEGLYRLFRLDPAEKPGRWSEHGGYTHPEDMARLRQAGLTAKEGGTPYEMEIRTYRKDGEPRWCLARGFPEKDADGRIFRLYGTVQDITARKRAEAEKARLEEQFYQSQKLESIGRLAGGAAHDLNNLLTPILGYGELLRDQMESDDRRRQAIEVILQAGRRASDLVRQLLAFSRRQPLEFRPVDVNVLLTGFEKLLRRTIREDIIIRMNLADRLPCIKGDHGQLEQVVMNMVLNAQDAMNGGGELTITTATDELKGGEADRCPDILPGTYVKLMIQDTGCGMDDTVRSHLFEPFYTTKGVGRGTGLGLSSAYGIVKQHGGDIQVDSHVGRGTTFSVFLPVTHETAGVSAALVEALGAEALPAPGGSETILLVEDEEHLRQMSRQLLEAWGYHVLAAAGGEEALSVMDRHDGRIHLLLTDIIMPGISGKELSFQALSRRPEVKVLFMTGYADDVIAPHGMQAEGVRILRKPFNARALAAKVRETLDG